MTTSTIATCDHGIVARTKRVILDRDVYEKKWKLGPFAKKKTELKEQGLLDKYGRMMDKTPEAYKLLFGDVDKATSYKEVADKLGKTMPADGEEVKKPSRKSSTVEAEKKEKKDKKSKRKGSDAAEEVVEKKSKRKGSDAGEADVSEKKKKREDKAAEKEKKAKKEKKDKKEKKSKKAEVSDDE